MVRVHIATVVAIFTAYSSSQRVAAFTIAKDSLKALPSSSTRLNLRSEQGAQLVAAFNAGSHDEYDDDDGNEDDMAMKNLVVSSATDDSSSKISTAVSHARALAARLFSLPAAREGKDNDAHLGTVNSLSNLASGLYNRSMRDEKETNDVLLFPVVGFTWVRDEEKHYRALPKISNPSCLLSNSRTEPVYGWYSAACKLDTYCDDELYGQKPRPRP